MEDSVRFLQSFGLALDHNLNFLKTVVGLVSKISSALNLEVAKEKRFIVIICSLKQVFLEFKMKWNVFEQSFSVQLLHSTLVKHKLTDN